MQDGWVLFLLNIFLCQLVFKSVLIVGCSSGIFFYSIILLFYFFFCLVLFCFVCVCVCVCVVCVCMLMGVFEARA